MSWIGIWYETISRWGSADRVRRERVVERTGRVDRTFAEAVQVAEPAHFAVDDLDVDAVEVHVEHVRRAIEMTFAIPVLAEVRRRHTGGEPLLMLGGGFVVRRVESRCQVVLDPIVVHRHV